MKTNIFSPVYTQDDLAFNLIFSGSTLFLAGLVQGLTVGVSRYPQIAVYPTPRFSLNTNSSHVHSQAIIVGMSLIVMGGLVTQSQFVGYLTPREVWTIWATSVPTWPMWIMQNAQSIWGTKKMNHLVSISSQRQGLI